MKVERISVSDSDIDERNVRITLSWREAIALRAFLESITTNEGYGPRAAMGRLFRHLVRTANVRYPSGWETRLFDIEERESVRLAEEWPDGAKI